MTSYDLFIPIHNLLIHDALDIIKKVLRTIPTRRGVSERNLFLGNGKLIERLWEVVRTQESCRKLQKAVESCFEFMLGTFNGMARAMEKNTRCLTYWPVILAIYVSIHPGAVPIRIRRSMCIYNMCACKFTWMSDVRSLGFIAESQLFSYHELSWTDDELPDNPRSPRLEILMTSLLMFW